MAASSHSGISSIFPTAIYVQGTDQQTLSLNHTPYTVGRKVDRDLVIEGLSLANAVIMYGLNFIGEPSTAMFRRRDLDRKSAQDDARPFQFNGEEVRGAFDLAIGNILTVDIFDGIN